MWYDESMKTIVVAYDRRRGIGADNELLWGRDLPADLAHFRALTLGKSIVMGRKTWESIGRALPGRHNIVVSRSGVVQADGATVVDSLQAAYLAATSDVVVIGGGEIYAQAMNDVDMIYATEVDAEFPGATVFFPQIDCQQWQEVSRDHHEADEHNKYAYDFVTYARTEADS